MSAIASFMENPSERRNDLYKNSQVTFVLPKFVATKKMRSGISGRIMACAFFLLTGCAAVSNANDTCKVIDPDLAQGVYAGGCKNGLADGYGEVGGASSYRGDFLAGKKHGKGIKVMPNGDGYAGNFSDDYRHGKGVYVWGPNTPWAGDRYEGEYQRDLRHGWGIFQWNSGDRYEGPWQNDLRMGASVMELRRAQAAIAAAKSINGAEQVCAEVQLGLVNRQRIRGKLESDTGEYVRVRIIEVEGGVANYRGNAVKAGDVITDAAANWQLCGKE